jgi:hypothetical protein
MITVTVRPTTTSGRFRLLAAAAGVPPRVLVDADDLHSVEPGRVVDEDPPSFGQDRVVGGVPRHPEPRTTRATVRCWTTMPSSAHRRPWRDSFARASAALLVMAPHIPHPVHR